MFRNDKLVRPQTGSLIGTLVVAVAVFFGAQTSPFVGYILAVGTLVIMIVASLMSSIWPTRGKRENRVVFSLFWGAMLGLIVPFLVRQYLGGGLKSVFEIFTNQS